MSFPFLRQRDSMQCGIACLAMICKFYDLDVSFFDMESYCPLSKNGTSMLALSNAAKDLGFTTLSGKYSNDQIRKIQAPCILHWNQNHFVVLYKVKRNRFYIADPAKGLVVYNEKEFQEHWIYNYSSSEENRLGIALVLYLSRDINHNITDKQNNSVTLYLKTVRYFTKYKHYFSIIGIALILNSILQLLMPFLTQAIVDEGINQNNINIIWIILIGELMIVLGRTFSEFAQSWIIVHVSARINIAMLYDFFKKLLQLPMRFFDSRLLGDLMQRMGDYSRIQSFFGGEILGVIISCFSFIILSIVLFLYNLRIFLIICGASILYSLWTSVFLSRRKNLDYEFFEKQSSNNNVVYQLLANMQEIKLQSCGKRRINEWSKTQLSLLKTHLKLLSLQQLQQSGSI